MSLSSNSFGKKSGYDPRITEKELPYFLKSEAGKRYLQDVAKQTGLTLEESEELIYATLDRKKKYSVD